MITTFQFELAKKLNLNKSISYKEILDILDAFQIASGQGFAIGKTKALLDFLKEGNILEIEDVKCEGDKVIKTVRELANIYKDIDQTVDLMTDKDFKNYFIN